MCIQPNNSYRARCRAASAALPCRTSNPFVNYTEKVYGGSVEDSPSVTHLAHSRSVNGNKLAGFLPGNMRGPVRQTAEPLPQVTPSFHAL